MCGQLLKSTREKLNVIKLDYTSSMEKANVLIPASRLTLVNKLLKTTYHKSLKKYYRGMDKIRKEMDMPNSDDIDSWIHESKTMDQVCDLIMEEITSLASPK
jgi:uncharacterized coiled-coil DUF342 family protein